MESPTRLGLGVTELPMVLIASRLDLYTVHIWSVNIGVSSCGTSFWFHRVSFSRGGFADCLVAPQKFGALRPRGSGEPAGEYLPPSTHRLFSLMRARQSKQETAWNQCGQPIRPAVVHHFSQDTRDFEWLA